MSEQEDKKRCTNLVFDACEVRFASSGIDK
jgi:hypothetical protein